MEKKIILDKKLFYHDLLWSLKDGSIISISNLITIYCSRPNQRDIDTLCHLFGTSRVKKIIKKNLNREEDKIEALAQVSYYMKEVNNSLLSITDEKSLLIHPSQRVIDKILQDKGEAYLNEVIERNNLPFSIKLIINEMKEYYIWKTKFHKK